MSKSLLELIRSKNPRQNGPSTVTGQAIAMLNDSDTNRSMSFSLESEHVRALYTGDESGADTVVGFAQELRTSVESLANSLNIDLSAAGSDAAVLSGMIASRPEVYRELSGAKPSFSLESNQFLVTTPNTGDEAERVEYSMEAYDQTDLRTTTVYTMYYNMKHGNQNEFAETFFPTVVIGPSEPGYTVSINIVSVHDDIRRDISGAIDDFRDKNIVHALIDDRILRDDQTLLIPIFRDESKKHFVEEALLPPVMVEQDGQEVTTSALKVNNKFSIIALSQSDAMLEVGPADTSDAVDASVHLRSLYVALSDDEVIKFGVQHMDSSNFWPAPQGNSRELNLSFNTESLQVSSDTKLVDGTDSTILAPVTTNGLSVRIGLSVTGSLNTRTGTTWVNPTSVDVVSITKDGQRLSLEDPSVKALVETLREAKVIGYDLHGYRINSNRRQRGQLLDVNFYSQIYTAKTRAPITVARPQTQAEVSEATDISALLVATGIRTTNSAIETLFQADRLLAEHVNNEDDITTAPRVLGIAKQAIKPFYEADVIDVEAELLTLNSSGKTVDMQNLFIDRFRDVVVRAWYTSGYKSAIDAAHGGQGPKPLVIIGTDPMIANYLMLHGDLRTFGNDFDYKIVSSENLRMKGKVFITFGTEAALKSNAPDCFHFGNMGWKTEIVMALPTHYNNANHRQVTVQPCYTHVVNLPILMKFEIKNIPESIQKKLDWNVNQTNP